MTKRILIAAMLAASAPFAATAQTPAAPAAQAPMFETKQVPGTDNVYYFRYAGHQALFVVMPQGVLATDPMSFRRPAAATYIAEIRKITQAPIRYLVYSHGHYDHATGGKPFKDAGATIIGHRNLAAAWKKMASNDDLAMPDKLVDDKMTLKLGNETIELIATPGHSDHMLTIYLPAHKLVFSADWLDGRGRAPNVGGVSNTFPIELEASFRKVLALDFTTLVPGHPGANNGLGTRANVEKALQYLVDLKADSKALSLANKCTPKDLAAVPVPAKYDGYIAADLYPGQLERYCQIWNQGY